MTSEEIQSELTRLLRIIRTDATVERVILFGSAVHPEKIHSQSDIDLCLIQRTDLRFYDRLAYWISRIQPRIGLDLVVYTPAEFEEMRETNYFIRREIEQNGRELYAA